MSQQTIDRVLERADEMIISAWGVIMAYARFSSVPSIRASDFG